MDATAVGRAEQQLRQQGAHTRDLLEAFIAKLDLAESTGKPELKGLTFAAREAQFAVTQEQDAVVRLVQDLHDFYLEATRQDHTAAGQTNQTPQQRWAWTDITTAPVKQDHPADDPFATPSRPARP